MDARAFEPETSRMPRFSERSRRRVASCHPDIQRVLVTAIEHGPDFAVLQGRRGRRAQTAALRAGHSQLPYPRSRHNTKPSLAVDVAPWPIDWDDTNRFRFLAGFLLGVAAVLGIRLRWGGDWDRDFQERDERFRDLPHFELVQGSDGPQQVA